MRSLNSNAIDRRIEKANLDVDAKSEDLPVKIRIGSSAKRNHMCIVWRLMFVLVFVCSAGLDIICTEFLRRKPGEFCFLLEWTMEYILSSSPPVGDSMRKYG